MAKIRIYELSKELNVASKVIIEKSAAELGITIKAAASTVDEDTAQKIRNVFISKNLSDKSDEKKINKSDTGGNKRTNKTDNAKSSIKSEEYQNPQLQDKRQDNRNDKNQKSRNIQYNKNNVQQKQNNTNNSSKTYTNISAQNKNTSNTNTNRNNVVQNRNTSNTYTNRNNVVQNKNNSNTNTNRNNVAQNRNTSNTNTNRNNVVQNRNASNTNTNRNNVAQNRNTSNTNTNRNNVAQNTNTSNRNTNTNRNNAAQNRNTSNTNANRNNAVQNRNNNNVNNNSSKNISAQNKNSNTNSYRSNAVQNKSGNTGNKNNSFQSKNNSQKNKSNVKNGNFNYTNNSKSNKNKNKNYKNQKNKSVEQTVEVKKTEPEEDELKIIKVPSELTIAELAEKMGKKNADVVKTLFLEGKVMTPNSTVDFDTASEIAEKFNCMLELEEEKDIFEQVFNEEPDDEKDLKERPPVVVVMGHVDHGKTSLLDAIRHSHVTSGEAGGITQHIGAYTVQIKGKPITFLDTPGHEAFTAMRMRGAQVTDIAVLVVAADDGVMPQTVEAINHAKAAGVDIIVAINKMDKPGANPERVKQELIEYGITAEDWGGDAICVPVSAVKKTGIDTLLEMITLTAEMKELKANPNKKARGAIIEAQLDKGRGPVATVLVQDGTLNVGDPVVAGAAFGKIRAMMDDKGKRVKKAGPSTPVEILGLSEVPSAGDTFYVAENEKQARQVAESVIAKNKTDLIKNTPQKVSLDDLFTQIQNGNVKELSLVVKADVQGSVEAVKQSLEKLSNDEVRVRVIHGGVGTITESDVMLASASNAIIIGFNVRPEPAAKTFAETEKVDVRLYRVIYNAIEDISSAMKGMLDPVYEEKVIGHAEVRQLYKASGVGTICGSYVTDGKFTRNSKARVVRDGVVVYEGELNSLKRFKDDAKEVNKGYDCGIVLNKFNDIKEGDVLEAFVMEEIPR
ncbi:MAG: translation initiation factor IF-2 [Clostridia bacterium]|nr:translation initiation factor IF-2 [Clostridia bacterium]MCI2000153.1 translation initiation factor IF-2 [Clostridia bacterium]MCI2014682.1 translation initiation factor IF-2 [Clostridia bacterium]